jgi:hypothetical protein
MRTSTLVLSACVLAGAVAVIGFRLNSTASAAAPAGDDPAIDRFLLQATGNLPACLIEKPKGGAPVIRVEMAAQCDQILPGLSQAHYWREKPDGAVELSADGLTPIVTFEVGDGVAYESIEPRLPLMTLIEANGN